MKEFLALIVLLSVHQTVGQCDCTGGVDFGFEFQDRTLFVIQGEPFTYCFEAVCGTSPGISFQVRRSYGSELPVSKQSTVFFDTISIPSGSVGPWCFTAVAFNRPNLDPTDLVILEIQLDQLPSTVCVPDDCDTAGVTAYETDVIEFEIKEEESTINAFEGDSEAEVCVHITCVDAPTLRAVPLLFYNEAVQGLIERQKKIVLIPQGTEDGDKVCCTFELNSAFEIDENQTIDIPVNVMSEDINVLGPAEATITVFDANVECAVCFDDDTPEVIGNMVRVSLPNCVTEATCTAVSNPNLSSGPGDTFLALNRRTFVSVTCTVTAPASATPTIISRSVRRDGSPGFDVGCDSHLLNKGFIDNGGNNFTMEFEGTGGPVVGGPTLFTCTVENPVGTAISSALSGLACSPPGFTFTVPAGTTKFYVRVIPIEAMCPGSFTRIFRYPDPDNA